MARKSINTLKPKQNCHHFADNILKCIFLNENVWITLKISLKFIPKVRINNIPALVQIMAWRRQGGKPLSVPMMFSLMKHICITCPQWVDKSLICFCYTEVWVKSLKCIYDFQKSFQFLPWVFHLFLISDSSDMSDMIWLITFCQGWKLICNLRFGEI